ncbi:MAG: propionyl-CoA synthetase [Acidimicrobiia bacterium]
MTTRDEVYERSVSDPEGFWGEAAKLISWDVAPTTVLTQVDEHHCRWFSDGVLNTCHNALDRHVAEGRGNQTALIYDSPVTGSTKTFTYNALLERVSRFAGGLASLGVTKGDTVIIYMPMVPAAVIAMLACARLGAVHSVVFGGFAPAELALRIDDAKPKVIISANAGVEVQRIIPYKPLLDEAIEMATHKPDHCVIRQRNVSTVSGASLPIAPLAPGRDVAWHDLMADAKPHPCVPVSALDPLYVLYTSGTTGKPKGVVRDNGGHAVAMAWSMTNVYGVSPGEVFWAASDVGWVVGHSYIVYGPLIAGATTVLYEGKPIGTPDPGAFWRVVADHDVSILFTAPTAFRAIKKEDPQGLYHQRYADKLTKFRALFLAGERLDPDTYHWASELTGVPVVDHWWQTETGWPIAANCLGIEQLPVRAGSPTKPVPGFGVKILDPETHVELPAGTEGAVVLTLPLPPGCLPTLWGNDERFIAGYLTTFPGYYTSGDGGYIDADGYLYVMGRIDDVINVAGHRLSTGEMEQILSGHRDVAECAVVGAADELKGQVPVAFVVLKSGSDRDRPALEAELVAMVRKDIGAVAAFKEATIVSRLPKTRSGKVLRATIRAITDAKPYTVPSTIDDPTSLDEIAEAWAAMRSAD